SRSPPRSEPCVPGKPSRHSARPTPTRSRPPARSRGLAQPVRTDPAGICSRVLSNRHVFHGALGGPSSFHVAYADGEPTPAAPGDGSPSAAAAGRGLGRAGGARALAGHRRLPLGGGNPALVQPG